MGGGLKGRYSRGERPRGAGGEGGYEIVEDIRGVSNREGNLHSGLVRARISGGGWRRISLESSPRDVSGGGRGETAC